jgi:hypothetical protein
MGVAETTLKTFGGGSAKEVAAAIFFLKRNKK